MKQTSEKSEIPAAELQTGDEKDSEQTGAKKSGTRGKNIYSRPSVKFSFTLSTHESQLIFRHTIRKINRLLYEIDVLYSRKIKDQQLLSQMRQNIENHFTEVERKIAADTDKLNARLVEEGFGPDSPEYTGKIELEVSINTPLMKRFTDLLIATDHLIMLADSCWLHGLTDSSVHEKENYARQHLVLQLYSLIIVSCEEISAKIPHQEQTKEKENEKADRK